MQVYIFKTNVAVITVCCCQTYTKKLKKKCLADVCEKTIVDRFAVSCCVKDFKLLRSFFFVALVHDVQDHLYDSYDSTLECIEAQSKHCTSWLAVNSNIERTTTGASQFCQKRLKGSNSVLEMFFRTGKLGFMTTVSNKMLRCFQSHLEVFQWAFLQWRRANTIVQPLFSKFFCDRCTKFKVIVFKGKLCHLPGLAVHNPGIHQSCL